MKPFSRILFEDPKYDTGKLVATFTSSGDLKIQHAVTPPLILQGALPFLESESLIEELLISPNQSLKFKATVKSWRDEIKKIETDLFEIESHGMENTKELIREKINESIMRHDEGWKELDTVLLPHQMKRLSQVSMWFYLRKVGVRGFFGDEKTSKSVALPSNGYQKITKFVIGNQKRLHQMVLESIDESLVELLSFFSEEQTRMVLKEWEYLSPNHEKNAERFRIHLMQACGIVDLDESNSPMVRFKYFPNYEMQVDGSFEATNVSLKIDSVAEKDAKVDFFFALLSEPSFVEALQLSGEQLLRLEVIGNELRHRLRESSTINLTWSPEKGSSLGSMVEEVRMISESAYHAASQSLDTTLTKEQENGLLLLAERALSRKMGPFWDISSGPLGDDLKLSKKEKELFSKKCKEMLERFEKSMCKVEDEWLKEIVDAVGDSGFKKEISESFGEPLLFNPPCISVYLSGQ